MKSSSAVDWHCLVRNPLQGDPLHAAVCAPHSMQCRGVGGPKVQGGGGGLLVGQVVARRRGPRGGSTGTPTFIPQNDPRDALIISNTHKSGNNFFAKKIAYPSARVSQGPMPEVGCQVKVFFFVFFTHV